MDTNVRIIGGETYDVHMPIKIGTAARYVGRGVTKFKELVKEGRITRYKQGWSKQSPAYYMIDDLDQFLASERKELGGKV